MDSTLKEHFCKNAKFAGMLAVGFPCDSVGKKSACKKCRRPGFDPWVGKIPWRRELATHSSILACKFRGLYSPWGHKESERTEQLSLSFYSLNHS